MSAACGKNRRLSENLSCPPSGQTSYRLFARDQRWSCWSLSRALSQNQGTQITASSSTRRTGAIPKDALGNQYDFFPLAGVLGLRTIPAYPNDLPVVPGLALILCEPPVRGTRRPVGTTCPAFLRDPTLCQVGVRKMCKTTCRAPLLPVVTSAKASVDRSRSSGMDVSESEPCIGRAFRKSQISRHGRYSFW